MSYVAATPIYTPTYRHAIAHQKWPATQPSKSPVPMSPYSGPSWVPFGGQNLR